MILLLDYVKLTSQQAPFVGEALSNMIPRNLNEVVFYNNDLSDHDFKSILHSMNEMVGLKIFGSINNGFGPQTVY